MLASNELITFSVIFLHFYKKIISIWRFWKLLFITFYTSKLFINTASYDSYILLVQGLPVNHIVPQLKTKVVQFKSGMPVVSSLKNPALKSRHWEAITDIIGTSIVNQKSFTLGKLIEMEVLFSWNSMIYIWFSIFVSLSLLYIFKGNW